MLMTLVQWMLHKTLNRLWQCHLGVQLNLCIFRALSPIRHSSNDICPSMTQNELLRPSSLLHRSLQICFSHAGIFSSCSHSLSTAALIAGIFIAWGIGINLCTKLETYFEGCYGAVCRNPCTRDVMWDFSSSLLGLWTARQTFRHHASQCSCLESKGRDVDLLTDGVVDFV